MKTLENEALSRHTTFKIGGPARWLKIPESQDELIAEIARCRSSNIPYRILGRGSNLLINDKGFNGVVLKNTKACSDLLLEGNLLKVGSSVALQKMIRFCVNNDFEGLEYLYSVPATVGGAVFMNAGRGRKHNLSISDRLVSVSIFDGTEVREISKEECQFGYRQSVFHAERDWLILGATLRLKEQAKEIGVRKIDERMEEIKVLQERAFPSAGTVFRAGFRAGRILRGLQVGGARFSGNWISNVDNASFQDVVTLIRIGKIVAACMLMRAKLEVEIWE